MQLPVPELVRRAPTRALQSSVRVPVAGVPVDVDTRLAAAAETLGLLDLRAEVRGRYRLEVPWRTHVCGVAPVRVLEVAELTVTTARLEGCLRLECLPQRTHDAHAAGVACLLAGAAAIGVGTYAVAGLLPAATLGCGGALWADATRAMSLAALERRLEEIATDLAAAIWPGAPPWPGGAAGVGHQLPSSDWP